MLKAVLDEAWKLAPFRVAVVHCVGKNIQQDFRILRPIQEESVITTLGFIRERDILLIRPLLYDDIYVIKYLI